MAKITEVDAVEVFTDNDSRSQYFEGNVVTNVPGFSTKKRFVVEAYNTWRSMEELYQNLKLRELLPNDSYDPTGQLIIVKHNQSDMEPLKPLPPVVVGKMRRVFV